MGAAGPGFEHGLEQPLRSRKPRVPSPERPGLGAQTQFTPWIPFQTTPGYKRTRALRSSGRNLGARRESLVVGEQVGSGVSFRVPAVQNGDALSG